MDAERNQGNLPENESQKDSAPDFAEMIKTAGSRREYYQRIGQFVSSNPLTDAERESFKSIFDQRSSNVGGSHVERSNTSPTEVRQNSPVSEVKPAAAGENVASRAVTLHPKYTENNLSIHSGDNSSSVNFQGLFNQTKKNGDTLPGSLLLAGIGSKISEMAENGGWNTGLVYLVRQYLAAALQVHGPDVIKPLLHAYQGRENELASFNTFNSVNNPKKINVFRETLMNIAQTAAEARYFSEITLKEIGFEGRLALHNHLFGTILTDPQATKILVDYLNCNINPILNFLVQSFDLDGPTKEQLGIIAKQFEVMRSVGVTPNPFNFETIQNVCIIVDSLNTVETSNAKNLAHVATKQSEIARRINETKMREAELPSLKDHGTQKAINMAAKFSNAAAVIGTIPSGVVGGASRAVINSVGVISKDVGEGLGNALPNLGSGIGKTVSGVIGLGREAYEAIKEGWNKHIKRQVQ